jgi:hypothetical protein
MCVCAGVCRYVGCFLTVPVDGCVAHAMVQDARLSVPYGLPLVLRPLPVPVCTGPWQTMGTFPPPPRHSHTHTGTRTPLSVSLSCHIYAMAPTPHQAHLCTHTHTHTHTSTHTLLLSHMRTPSYSFLLCFPTMNEHTCAHPNSLCLYISLSSCFSLSLSFTLVPCILMIVMVGRGSGRTRGRPQRRCSRTLPRGIPRQPSSWGAPKCLPATTCTGARPWHPHTRIRTHIRACRAPFSCFGSRHTHRHTHTNVD